ncbi:MAG: hypothetical protein ACI867_002584 [Glaciecola sp.]|jgi:hypothetical protein
MSTAAAVARQVRGALPRRESTARAQRPALTIVRRTQPRHPLLWLIAIIAMLSGSVLGAVSLNALAAADSVAARQLEQDVVVAERRHAMLIAEVAHLDAPERIRQAATQELGMIEAPAPRYVVLDRSLPSDTSGASSPDGDPLKPVLAAER